MLKLNTLRYTHQISSCVEFLFGCVAVAMRPQSALRRTKIWGRSLQKPNLNMF